MVACLASVNRGKRTGQTARDLAGSRKKVLKKFRNVIGRGQIER